LNPNHLQQLLEQVRSGAVAIDEALARLRHLPFEDLGFAKVDHHRRLRRGAPEVIFSQGKAVDHVVSLFEAISAKGETVLATRAAPETYAAVAAKFPKAEFNALGRTIVLWGPSRPAATGLVAVVSAGTADLPVAEEARVTAEVMGAKVETFFDVGVAGIHRLLAQSARLQQANAIVAVAGMEGALPGVVSGLVEAPVIAVPTSVGYGASFGGLAPLLTMLNSCSSGAAVVNIDGGFNGGYMAAVINRLACRGGGKGSERA
jgi:hypothetical protein